MATSKGLFVKDEPKKATSRNTGTAVPFDWTTVGKVLSFTLPVTTGPSRTYGGAPLKDGTHTGPRVDIYFDNGDDRISLLMAGLTIDWADMGEPKEYKSTDSAGTPKYKWTRKLGGNAELKVSGAISPDAFNGVTSLKVKGR